MDNFHIIQIDAGDTYYVGIVRLDPFFEAATL